MKRYFYTDPLKAAWMAREFGVKFISHGGADLIYNGGDYFSVIDCPHGHYMGEYYHVHPDSLPIFEPKVGDYYINTGERKNAGKLSKQKTEAILSYIRYHNKWPIQVIQRDNKAFFMPEVEE